MKISRSPFPTRRRTRKGGGWLNSMAWLLAAAIVMPLTLAVLYKFAPVPVTPLMVLRVFEGEGFDYRWVPLERMSPALPQMVLAAEDNLFCRHNGFDWKALDKAYAIWEKNGVPTKGGSTLSQQTAKNVFLWPGSILPTKILRKVFEFPLTFLIENLWGKSRIIEVYLNVVEFGPGIYGVEAASQRFYGVPAYRLSRQQAAQLAAVLPSPRRWSADEPGPYVRSRARIIQSRIPKLGPLLACLPRRS